MSTLYIGTVIISHVSMRVYEELQICSSLAGRFLNFIGNPIRRQHFFFFVFFRFRKTDTRNNS